MPGYTQQSMETHFNFFDEEVALQAATVDPKSKAQGGDSDGESDDEVMYVRTKLDAAPSTVAKSAPRRARAKSAAGRGKPKPGTDFNPEMEEASDDENGEEGDEGDDEENGGRLRRNGKFFVTQRKITADLDPTDEMIVRMKDNNFTNEAVAEALKRNGLVAYDKKTVGSRYIRLKRVLAERETQRLDDELTDWHDGEDEALIQADKLAQEQIKELIQRAKNDRWPKVAKNLQKILSKEADLKYNPKSCQKRFVNLMNDVATIPPELSDNPITHQIHKAARTHAILSARQLAEATAREEKEQKQELRETTRLRKALERKARAQKKAEEAIAFAAAAEEKFGKLTKKSSALQAERKAAQAQAATVVEKFGLDLPMGNDEASSALSSAPASPPPTASTSKTGKKSQAKLSLDQEVADSPRQRLSVHELGAVLGSRSLTKSGTKAAQIKRLDDHDNTMSPDTLRSKLADHGVATEGSRVQLIARLVQVEVSESAWGQKYGGGLAPGSKRTAFPNVSAVSNKRARVDPAATDGEDSAIHDGESASVGAGTVGDSTLTGSTIVN